MTLLERKANFMHVLAIRESSQRDGVGNEAQTVASICRDEAGGAKIDHVLRWHRRTKRESVKDTQRVAKKQKRSASGRKKKAKVSGAKKESQSKQRARKRLK